VLRQPTTAPLAPAGGSGNAPAPDRKIDDMRQRRFGRTGLAISELTLGGGIVGGILIHPPDAVRLEALERCVRAGCNWIDTAADYGQGESERALGRLLHRLDPRPHLSTKVRIDPAALDDLEGQIRRSLQASLDRLQAKRVDLFQLHNPIAATGDGRRLGVAAILGQGGVADIFDRLRQEGHFDHHGITALGETPAILEVLRSGRFDTAQVYFNMLNPSASHRLPRGSGGQDLGGIMAACRQQDMGIMNIRVLAGGVLASDVRHGREVVITEDAELAREAERARRLFAGLGERHGTRAQTAIRYALANADLSTLVIGVASLAQLDEALAAVAAGPLPATAMREIEAAQDQGL
jgi:L-galactose dehydrogenase/L-glyceraldehyde 3-phosphate reductase